MIFDYKQLYKNFNFLKHVTFINLRFKKHH